MDRNDDIDELLDRWEALRAAGKPISPEELCRDCPELLDDVRRHVEALQWVPEPAVPGGGLLSFSSQDAAGRPVVHPPVPPTLGRYRLVEPIGAGGFGQVWRAYDPELQRHVAIKIPRSGRATSRVSADRFLEEARKVAQLRHPGIVPVHDVGRQDDWCYIVSELIEGESLAERVALGPVATADAVRIVAAVADLLHVAHEHGFVHRDVKPANILLDGGGNAFLADFGIAATEEQLQAEREGTSGTLAYMAPEQARGDAAALDRRSDVFSLGVVLYELLTRRRPFVSEQPHQLRELILKANPLPPRQCDSSISAGLEQVCLTALAKEPGDRFQSAAAMAESLRAVTKAGSKRGKPLALVAAIALVTLAALSLIVWWTGKLGNQGATGTGRARTGDGAQSTIPGATAVPAETSKRAPPAPGGPVPGSPERKSLEGQLARQAESAILPRLEEIHNTLDRAGKMPPIPKPPPVPSTKSDHSFGPPDPVVWFRFDEPADRLRNSGRLGSGSGLQMRGKVVFTEPGDPDAPPKELGNGARLNNGAGQEGLIGDKSLLKGTAWSISLWYWQRESHDKDFLFYVGGLDGYGGGSPEFSAAVVPPGILEVVCFPDITPAGQQTIVGQLRVEPCVWHHLAITFRAKDTALTSAGTAVVYLDGCEVGRRDDIFLASTLRFSKAAFVFGAVYRKFQADTWQRALDGVLADVRVYDTDLRDHQIAALWQRGRGKVPVAADSGKKGEPSGEPGSWTSTPAKR